MIRAKYWCYGMHYSIIIKQTIIRGGFFCNRHENKQRIYRRKIITRNIYFLFDVILFSIFNSSLDTITYLPHVEHIIILTSKLQIILDV